MATAFKFSAARPGLPQLHLLGRMSLLPGAGGGISVGAAASYEGRHHVQAVLSLVGQSRKGMARDELVEVLWPQSSATAGRNRLYHTVHLARQALSAVSWDDEWLMVRNARVVLDERVWCDMHQLEQASARETTQLGDAELHNLVPLCSADWMPELDVGGVGVAVRARVRAAQAAVLREAIVRSQRQGDTPALRALLHSLLRIQSSDEWVHRELMRLDLAAGRRHAVLRTFDALSRQLGVQLGLRPSAQTMAIAAAATAELQGHANVGAAEPAARATALVGREALIQSLVAEMSERAGLWNFTGLSGIGKTSLARAVAQRLAPTLADGVCVVNLGDLGAYETAASACVRTLGLGSHAHGDEADEGDLLVRALQAREMLLILDDIDVASDAQHLLARLPLGQMRARVIVTTRARVNLTRAAVVPVPPLPAPVADATPAQARQSAAFALFQMRCPLASHELAMQAWQSEAVQLVRRLEGLPLAIELAAARTASMTPGEILRQLERTLRPLGDGPVDMPGRHQSLQAALDWSVKLLSEPARSGYAALAVFPGGFTASEARGLMPAVGVNGGAAEAVLDELLAAGLLTPLPDPAQPGPGLGLRMLHLPRAHARAQAEARGQWRAVVTARLADVCSSLDAHPLAYESPQYAAHLRRVGELEDDAVALLDHAQAHDPARFVRMLSTLCESWGVHGSVPIMMRWIEAGTVAAQSLGLADRELALRAVWTHALRVRESAAAAEQCSQTMMPLLARVPDPVMVARAAVVRCAALRAIGQQRQGVEVLQQLLKTLALSPNDPGFWTLCMTLTECDCQPEGIEIDLPALRQRFAGSRMWLEILVVTSLAAPVGGDWGRLLAVTDELIVSATAMRAHAALFSGMSARAYCQLALGDAASALRNYEACYQLAAETGWNNAMARARLDAASVQVYSGETAAAAACIDEAGAMLSHGAHLSILVRVPLLHAMVLALRGEFDAAVRELLGVQPDQVDQVAEDALCEWAEVAGLLVLQRGYAGLGAQIVAGLRCIDKDHDQIPAVRQFRNRLFGPADSTGCGSTLDVHNTRRNLRLWLKSANQHLR